MRLHFSKSNLEDLQVFLNKYIDSLSSPIESYLEEKILLSEHFKIVVDESQVGYFSILEKEMLTQFYLEPEYRQLGQKIFFEMKKMQTVLTALVPTCDEFFLSHALDEHRSLERQAYFFQDSQRQICVDDVSIRLAQLADVEQIVHLSGDFFDKIEERIANEEIYIATRMETIVGFGLIIKGILLKDYASLGMYTVDTFRQQGIGRSILLQLKQKVYESNLQPLAGCWYYNHYSKKTLESAGLYSNTRLLKIHY